MLDAVAVADEDRAAPDAGEAEHVGGDDVVARPQQPDEEDREHDGRRRQAVRPELAVRSDPVDERHDSDEDQRADDPAAAGAAVALGVEPGAPEDEQHHEHDERQPLGLHAPERAPEDVLPVDERAHDQRRVETEDQPAEVEDDQGEDAGRAAEEGRDRAAEDVGPPGPDVAERGRRSGSLTARRRRFLRSHL